MTTMFLICGGLSTIVIIVYLFSVYLTRWAIRTDFGRMLTTIYLSPDEQIKKEYFFLSKQDVMNEIAILHCKLHVAMTDEKFSLVDILNRRIFIATCRFADIISQEIKK